MDYIPIAKPFIGEEEAKAVYDQVKSGWITMGKRVREFESMLEDYIGVRHAIAFNSGTATLHALLLALGVGPGDEVIVPSLSYASSANVAILCGAKPVFAEEDPKTFNVSAEEFERRITPKTKVIMAVDLKGLAADFDAIQKVCEKHNISLIGDSAESFGGKYKGNPIGSQVLAHSFSMFANKSITCGEGGFVTTNDDALAERCRVIRNQGQSERYVHVELGHNYRMTDIAAAFAIEQLKRVDWFIEEKGKIVARYMEAFADHPLISPPYLPDYATQHSWYMYCISLDKSVNRDAMIKAMQERGVDHRLSFPPIPLQPYYRELYGYTEEDFPVSGEIFNRFIDIPCWVGMTDEEITHVIDTVLETAVQVQNQENGNG